MWDGWADIELWQSKQCPSNQMAGLTLTHTHRFDSVYQNSIVGSKRGSKEKYCKQRQNERLVLKLRYPQPIHHCLFPNWSTLHYLHPFIQHFSLLLFISPSLPPALLDNCWCDTNPTCFEIRQTWESLKGLLVKPKINPSIIYTHILSAASWWLKPFIVQNRLRSSVTSADDQRSCFRTLDSSFTANSFSFSTMVSASHSTCYIPQRYITSQHSSIHIHKTHRAQCSHTHTLLIKTVFKGWNFSY